MSAVSGSGGVGVGLRNGDWLCGGCSAHNYASRAACFKCKMEKGEAMAKHAEKMKASSPEAIAAAEEAARLAEEEEQAAPKTAEEEEQERELRRLVRKVSKKKVAEEDGTKVYVANVGFLASGEIKSFFGCVGHVAGVLRMTHAYRVGFLHPADTTIALKLDGTQPFDCLLYTSPSPRDRG